MLFGIFLILYLLLDICVIKVFKLLDKFLFGGNINYSFS